MASASKIENSKRVLELQQDLPQSFKKEKFSETSVFPCNHIVSNLEEKFFFRTIPEDIQFCLPLIDI